MSKTSLCYKCRWVVADPGGFFKRKKPNGPCDRCLGSMTTFQVADENRIWIKYVPEKVQPKKSEDSTTPHKVVGPPSSDTQNNNVTPQQ